MKIKVKYKKSKAKLSNWVIYDNKNGKKRIWFSYNLWRK